MTELVVCEACEPAPSPHSSDICKWHVGARCDCRCWGKTNKAGRAS